MNTDLNAWDQQYQEGWNSAGKGEDPPERATNAFWAGYEAYVQAHEELGLDHAS